MFFGAIGHTKQRYLFLAPLNEDGLVGMQLDHLPHLLPDVLSINRYARVHVCVHVCEYLFIYNNDSFIELVGTRTIHYLTGNELGLVYADSCTEVVRFAVNCHTDFHLTFSTFRYSASVIPYYRICYFHFFLVFNYRHREAFSIHQVFQAIPIFCRVLVVGALGCDPSAAHQTFRHVLFPRHFYPGETLGETYPLSMSHNVAFCIFSYSHRFNENLSVYGGCAHFDAYPHQIESDPFGAMRGLCEMTIYK